MMSFFQNGVIGQRQPGKALTLMSDYGVRVIKKVDAILFIRKIYRVLIYNNVYIA